MKESVGIVDESELSIFSADYIISLERLAQHALTLQGKVPLQDLTHVTESTLHSEGWVTFFLAFARSHDGRMSVEGTLDVVLSLQCQRCCQPMELTLHLSPRLVVVSEEEADHLDEDVEALVLSGEPLQLGQLIEEEILLQMPLIPRHADDACEWVFKKN